MLFIKDGINEGKVIFTVTQTPTESISLSYLIIGFEITENAISVYDGEVIIE
jgi:hypothetical protein